jgi:hypothetical protein
VVLDFTDSGLHASTAQSQMLILYKCYCYFASALCSIGKLTVTIVYCKSSRYVIVLLAWIQDALQRWHQHQVVLPNNKPASYFVKALLIGKAPSPTTTSHHFRPVAEDVWSSQLAAVAAAACATLGRVMLPAAANASAAAACACSHCRLLQA